MSKLTDFIQTRIKILQLSIKNNEKYYLKTGDIKIKEKIEKDKLELENFKNNFPEYFV